MIYADEAFYLNNYLAGRKPVISAGFEFYARQASRTIDLHTFGRLGEQTDIPEVVQMCCCELAELEYRQEKQRNASAGKVSEKVGTYSVSFATAPESADAALREERKVVLKWLSGTGLCYQGV